MGRGLLLLVADPVPFDPLTFGKLRTGGAGELPSEAALGELQRSRDTSQSDQFLRASRPLFQMCGAVPLARRSTAEPPRSSNLPGIARPEPVEGHSLPITFLPYNESLPLPRATTPEVPSWQGDDFFHKSLGCRSVVARDPSSNKGPEATHHSLLTTARIAGIPYNELLLPPRAAEPEVTACQGDELFEETLRCCSVAARDPSSDRPFSNRILDHGCPGYHG